MTSPKLCDTSGLTLQPLPPTLDLDVAEYTCSEHKMISHPDQDVRTQLKHASKNCDATNEVSEVKPQCTSMYTSHRLSAARCRDRAPYMKVSKTRAIPKVCCDEVVTVANGWHALIVPSLFTKMTADPVGESRVTSSSSKHSSHVDMQRSTCTIRSNRAFAIAWRQLSITS